MPIYQGRKVALKEVRTRVLRELYPDDNGDDHQKSSFRKFFSNAINADFLEQMNVDYEWVGASKSLIYPNSIPSLKSSDASIEEKDVLNLSDSAIIDDQPSTSPVTKKRSAFEMSPNEHHDYAQPKKRARNDHPQPPQPATISSIPALLPEPNHNMLVNSVFQQPQPVVPALLPQNNNLLNNILFHQSQPVAPNQLQQSNAKILPSTTNSNPMVARLIGCNNKGVMYNAKIYQKSPICFRNVIISFNELAHTAEIYLNGQLPYQATINRIVVQPGSRVLLFDGDTITINNALMRFERIILS